ncbi:PREDICTED: topless-related protein 4 isoform X1 [Theobroma cacao]|uniref:Topless-related protein 4 isoform X1 n=1 Tax=Theobroma cacao TaxID=3641 RepID=A0AB32UYG1_THECC|nr:PREDICTED: topless-related protein 4 isoform X1 [Theobroma cacao]
MPSLSRELVFLILQFLDEEKYKETAYKLEEETGFFFNMRYFENCITNGEWEEVEKYLSGFTKFDDNRYSMKIFFEIQKQKYLEALDKREKGRALEILVKDLKVFSTFNEELYKEITMLLTLENFRENEQLSKYGNTKSARAIMLVELKKLIEVNPVFRDKLQFPTLKNSRLRTLINQSLNWQHQLCKNSRPNPEIKTLFVDHTCGPPNGARAPSPVTNPLMGSIPKVGGFPLIGACGPFQPAAASAPALLTASIAGWMANPSSVANQAVSASPIGLSASGTAASMVKRPRTPTINLAMDYQTADSENVLKRPRPFGISEEMNSLPVTYPGQSHAHTLYSSDDLPKSVFANIDQGSTVKSMDFHPVQQTLLLVGTNIGDISIWEVGSRERLVSRNFKVWNHGACSMTLQATLASECTAAVNQVIWSSDGDLLGVAYSKHIVHVYSYHGSNDLRSHLEIEAHIGSVNDLAFSQPNKQLWVVTCGDDKTIKVWDAVTGNRQFTFDGHEGPVYSVCPHQKENIPFIFSTAIDGKIKAWLYDNLGSRVDYDAPGHSCTTMAYSTDGTRLFSCGSNKEGESHIVEWNESEGAVKRTYCGLGKQSVGIVQFDTTRSRFLAAGDEFQVKFWDMDNVNLLTAINADGGLAASPCLRFTKNGNLLAVSTNDNGIKILANSDGIRLLRSIESCALDASRVASAAAAKGPIISTFGTSSSTTGTSIAVADRSAPMTANVGLNVDSRNLPDVRPRVADELEKSKIWKLTEIHEPSQLRSLRLPDSFMPIRLVRMIYTNSGGAILALTDNAVHKLWKWQKNEQNLTGKATSSLQPQLWQPSSGIMMTNDIRETNQEDAVPCFALSKNDSYVLSASGRKVSLFNLMTFKTMTTFMAPPPAATFLAFHPKDNNFIAIGMDDSSIQIYNVRVDQVKSKLRGHQKRVTGLAFSNALNVLVSSGADAQLCAWSMDGWEKLSSKFLQIPSSNVPDPFGQTRVHFHHDQIHVLAVHGSQIAIYEAPKLECLKQWIPQESNRLITDAVYSSDSQSIYASFGDGSVYIFVATTLQVRCRISLGAYLPSNPRVYPVVVAAHPSEPNQFALGLTDGGVHVLEPPEEGWGSLPPPEIGAGPSISATGAGSDQQTRRTKSKQRQSKTRRTEMQQRRDERDATSAKSTLRLLENTVRDILADRRRLVEVPYTATLGDTLNALVANKVGAVPVAAPPGHWIGAGGTMTVESDKLTGAVRKHYIGMVTMLDIVSHIADDRTGGADLDKKMVVPVSSIIGQSLEGLSLWTLNPNTSLLECMELFSKGIHRALVPMDSQMENVQGVELVESASSYRMLTQMDLLKFLKDHASELEDIISSSVKELGTINENVYAINDRTKVIEGIKCLRTALLNAVPIVQSSDDIEEDHRQLINGKGRKLIGTFSGTDLRGCHFSALQTWLPLRAHEFTELVSTSPLFAAREGLSPKQLVTCHPDLPLSEVIDKVVSQHVHRVWVVDQQGLLVGLVSLSDIVRVMRVSMLSKIDVM